MKRQVHPTIKTPLVRSAGYILTLLAVFLTPFALAQQETIQQNSEAAAAVTDQSLFSQNSWGNAAGSRLPRVSSGIGVRPILIRPIPKFPEVILYDQLDNPGTFSWVSQEFPDMADFDAFLADDFFVPGGESWQVTEVHVQGVYFNGPGPANNFNVFFYEDDGGLPGRLLLSRMAQAYVEINGLFEVTLTAPVTCASGIYWVSVQAHMIFDPNGQWGWTERTVQANSPAAWQNPAGGFGVCPTWDLRTTCLGAGDPDQMFRLIGTVGPPPTPTATPRSRPTPRPHSTPLPRPTP
jgi:hypothetical protein